MANNRMWLLCNICCPNFEKVPPIGGYCLGKWYPGHTEHGGYSRGDFSGLDKFMDDHNHNNNEYPLRLEYEAEKEN